MKSSRRWVVWQSLLAATLGGCAVVPDGMLAYRPPVSFAFTDPIPLDVSPVGQAETPAKEMYPYAAMSENVYEPRSAGDASRPRTPALTAQACSKGSSSAVPIGRSWLLQGFPADADELDDKYNLRVQLWGRRQAAGARIEELVLVFRGTESGHGRDWFANLRWVIHPRLDHYDYTVNNIVPAFQAWLEDRILDGTVSSETRVITTGHSLGGGLAQQMAYAFKAPSSAGTMRVERVYAFDPSPVTGWFGTDKALRELNAMDLRIDRILEDGEALSYLRTVLGVFVRPSDKRPSIWGVKFNFKHSYNPLSNHSMRLIACSLAKYASPGAADLDTSDLEEE